MNSTTHVAGHNFLSDYFPHERKSLCGLIGQPNLDTLALFKDIKGDAPDAVDWVTKGIVNPIKDQGRCGSCWAFASTAVMESMHAIKTGELLSLSE